MAASRGETRSYRRRLRGGAALLVLAAALAALLIGSRAHSDSAPPALTTSTTAMMASDGKSAEAAWPALTDPGWPPPDFTDPLERPRTPAAQPLGVPAIAAHEALASLASASVARADAVTQVSPATSPSGVDRQQSVAGAARQTIRGTQTEYTWEDGDRTLTVTLQTDLAIEERTGEEFKDAIKDALAATPRGNVVRSADSRGRSTGLPVFTSPSGDLMTLPGGVLLLLDQDWGEARVKRFFADNRHQPVGRVCTGVDRQRVLHRDRAGLPVPDAGERPRGAGGGGNLQPQLVAASRTEVGRPMPPYPMCESPNR